MANELEIKLTLIDEASEPVKTAITGIKGETDKLKTSGEQTGRAIQDEFKKAGKELRDFRQSLFLITAAFGTAIVSVREASKYNREAKVTFDQFATSMTSLSVTIGKALEPALKGVTVLVNILRDTITAAIAGFVKLFSLITELFIGLWENLRNVADNIKNFFTKDEDPVGIVEGFRQSWVRAMEISNAAADEFLKTIETTRAAVEGGITLDKEVRDVETAEKAKAKASEERAKTEKDLKVKAIADTKSMLHQIAAENKAAAVAFQALSIVEAVIATAKAVAKALPNIPLAVAVGAMGAAQVALIASQKFHSGGLVQGGEDVPIIAQGGEGVLSRRGMRALGGTSRLDALNRGQSNGGGNTEITIIIERADMSSEIGIERTAEMLGYAVSGRQRVASGF